MNGRLFDKTAKPFHLGMGRVLPLTNKYKWHSFLGLSLEIGALLSRLVEVVETLSLVCSTQDIVYSLDQSSKESWRSESNYKCERECTQLIYG